MTRQEQRQKAWKAAGRRFGDQPHLVPEPGVRVELRHWGHDEVNFDANSPRSFAIFGKPETLPMARQWALMCRISFPRFR